MQNKDNQTLPLLIDVNLLRLRVMQNKDNQTQFFNVDYCYKRLRVMQNKDNQTLCCISQNN